MYLGDDPDVAKLLDLFDKDSQAEVKRLLDNALYTAFEEGKEEGEHDGYQNGLESSGDYVSNWIEDGDYDWEVERRAPKIGFVRAETLSSVVETGDEMLQSFHRKHHKDSAYHWTFCGKCSKIDN